MKIKLLLITLLLVGCASASKPDYRVNYFNEASLDRINQADSKRQQEYYSDAIELYLEAESYALRSNNQQVLNISKLKRALVDLVLDNQQSAQTLIDEVETANRVEGLELDRSILFVQSKALLARDQKEAAFKILSSLEAAYASNIEKKTYYQLVRWSQDYQQIDSKTIQKKIDALTARFDNDNLENIEILSFAYLEQARWAADHSSFDRGEPIMLTAIDHFSLLELPSKIATSFKLAATFYQRHDDPEKSAYYLKNYENLMVLREQAN